MATIIVLVLIFLLGASIGSFLSVVLYRVKNNKKGIVFGQSFCPSCRKTLSFADMIPIISYLAQRGRCRYCKVSISPHYLFLEIICGLVLLSLYFKFPFLVWLENGTAIPDIDILIQYIFFTIYCSIFVGIFFYDLQTSKIPDLFLFPLIGVAVIGSLIIGNPPITSILIAVAIALVFFGGQILVSKGKWLGEGDVYFAVGLAVILGWQLFLVAIVASYILGALISIPLLISKKGKN